MDPTPEPGSSPAPPASPSLLQQVFFNDFELRAGWRFLIFYLTFEVVRRGVDLVAYLAAMVPSAQNQSSGLEPGPFIWSDGLGFVALLGLSAVAAAIEGRKLRHYGLPCKSAFRGNFWLGCLWGFVAISALLLALRADHNFYFGSFELNGWSIARFAAWWAIAFLLVSLYEEFYLRGYLQFALTIGIGFWPAALFLSLLFAAMHWDNPGETSFGLCQVVLIALFFCFTLWRTGTLWFAVGFHAAWDWGQSFFYGTPDSGLLARGHLLHSSFAGSPWLTGGSVGPEGSILLTPLFVLIFVLFYLAFPTRVPYPDPEAIRSSTLGFGPPKAVNSGA
jgi:membrane protease YdiL (CAAX protease family)